MADPTAVNEQITDAVTQSNQKVIAESPAVAVSKIYQAAAQSAGMMLQNAIAQQNNQYVENNAATIEGIALLYDSPTAASAAQADKTRAASPETIREKSMHASAATASAFATQTDRVNAEIEAAVKLANDSALAHAGDVAHAIRTSAEAIAAALRTLSATLHEDRVRMLQTAATAVCLDAMLRDPSKAAEYEAVLRTIKAIR